VNLKINRLLLLQNVNVAFIAIGVDGNKFITNLQLRYQSARPVSAAAEHRRCEEKKRQA